MHTAAIHLDVESAEDALCELGTRATEAGYVEETYVDAVLDREATHPTGLSVQTASFGVAIPHADVDRVKEQGLIVGLPSTPVQFHSMDDPDRTVDVEVILLLLVTDTDGYATFLSNLANLFSDEAFIEAVRSDRGDRVIELISEHCLDVD